MLRVFDQEQPPIKKRPLAERLAEKKVPYDDIPKCYLCKISYEIAPNPVILTLGETKIVVDHGQLTTWLAKPTSGGRNPFNNMPLKMEEISINLTLQRQIHHFVIRWEWDDIVKRVEELAIVETNIARLRKIQFNIKDLPIEYCDLLLANNVITIPIKLDNNTAYLDYYDLVRWWADPANQYKNPYTGDYLYHVEIDEVLLKELDAFISEKEKKFIETRVKVQLASIEKIVSATSSIPYDPQLQRANLQVKDIPNRFISPFSGKILNHPVRLDQDYIIDYHELIEWWNESEINTYKNPYTGEWVTTITYDQPLKTELGDYVKNIYQNYFNQLPKATPKPFSTSYSWFDVSSYFNYSLFQRPITKDMAAELLDNHSFEPN